MMSPASEKWLEAMKSNIGSIDKNKVWTLVDLPDDRQALRINGSSRGRWTLMVMLLSTNLELSQNVFDKFKELTTMRLSNP